MKKILLFLVLVFLNNQLFAPNKDTKKPALGRLKNITIVQNIKMRDNSNGCKIYMTEQGVHGNSHQFKTTQNTTTIYDNLAEIVDCHINQCPRGCSQILPFVEQLRRSQ